jgi:hypothetical protein
MRGVSQRHTAARAALITLTLSGAALAGDEPGFFGRLFRGNSGPASAPSSRPPERSSTPPPPALTTTPSPGPAPALLGTPPSAIPAFPPPSTPTLAGPSPAPRVRPQPRVSRAATEADPILTRIALGRSDNGDQFGMFLQVYADGTVIDGEGVHRVNAETLRPLVQALQAPELGRLKGHCGAPPTDFIEQVYVTVYERAKLGGLRANTFSFTGNPQGCDPAVRQLHAAIEGLVTKLSTPPGSTAPTPHPTPPPAPTLSLTPAN